MVKRICVFLICVFVMSSAAGCGVVEDTQDTDAYVPRVTESGAESDMTAAVTEKSESAEAEISINENIEESEYVSEADALETMSDEERRGINVFLSNFSEAQYGLGYFLDESEDRVNFAFVHNIINNKDFKVKLIRDNYAISADLVDSTLRKYFGETVLHETPGAAEQWWYENKHFVTNASDGESYAYFSTATCVLRRKDGNYEVDFYVYFNANDPHGEIDSQWYSMTAYEAQQYFEFCYDGKAVIKPVNGSYELVSYETSL